MSPYRVLAMKLDIFQEVLNNRHWNNKPYIFCVDKTLKCYTNNLFMQRLMKETLSILNGVLDIPCLPSKLDRRCFRD